MFPFIPYRTSRSKDPRHFEIDLTKEETREAGIKSLERIAALSLCYQHASSRNNPTTNMKFLFVITSDNVYSDELGVPNPDVQIDCIFGGKRFYDAIEIFSTNKGDKYNYLHLYTFASPLKTFTFGSENSYWKEWGDTGPIYPIEVSEVFPISDPSSWWY